MAIFFWGHPVYAKSTNKYVYVNEFLKASNYYVNFCQRMLRSVRYPHWTVQ